MRISVRGHFQTSNRPKPVRSNHASRPVCALCAAGLVALVVVALLSFGRPVALAQTAGAGNAQNGKMLFADKGCAGCHGADAHGMSPVESPTGGPRITPPPLGFMAFVDFVRNPSGKMIPFSPQDASDSQLADIYAYLQSLTPGGNGQGGARQAQAAAPGEVIDSMSDLMVSMVYPAANNILLSVYRGGPQNDADWESVQRSAVLLAESGNVLLTRGPAGDQGDWAKDAKALVDAGAATYRAARTKDTKALLAVDQPINASCVNCHKQYRFTGPREGYPLDTPPVRP